MEVFREIYCVDVSKMDDPFHQDSPGAAVKGNGGCETPYSYLDEDGVLLFQAVRFEPGKDGEKKSFRQRRPDGNGGWHWDLRGVRRVPYRLPELVNAPADRPVFVVEGEKDVDNLH